MSLIQKLISWQQDTARKSHLEPYMVLQFGTIKDIVRLEPKTGDELLRIKGIGAVKVKKYGNDILKIVRGEGVTGGEVVITAGDSGSLFDEAAAVNDAVSSSKIPASAGMTKGAVMINSAGMTKSTGMTKKEIRVDEVTGEIIEEKGEDSISVTEFVTMLDTMLQTNFRDTRVQGEVTGFKRNPNGHAYFEIKDKESVLRVAVFKNSYDLSGVTIEDGMEIIVTGHPNYHKQYGFSFIGQTVELYGEGALKKAYDDLKKKLDTEGLLSDERKRELPNLPRKIGLITSRSGAAIGDFTTNVGDYGYKIIFHHSTVEGANALRDIKNALTTMANEDIDVLVIVRGGGSLESLQAFNNETIVRMIADFPVPVVAGVGHEQDETLTTLVADYGASTPTAAAHAVRESWDEVDKFLDNSEQYILNSFDKSLSDKKSQLVEQEHFIKNIFDTILQDAKDLFVKFNFTVQKLEGEIVNKKRNLQNNLKELLYSLDKIVSNYGQVIDKATSTLLNFQSTVELNKKQINFLEKSLESHNPKRQLMLGYSITTNASGKVIRSVKNVKKGDKINTQVVDGKIEAKVIK